MIIFPSAKKLADYFLRRSAKSDAATDFTDFGVFGLASSFAALDATFADVRGTGVSPLPYNTAKSEKSRKKPPEFRGLPVIVPQPG
jgi:hypothetical protein